MDNTTEIQTQTHIYFLLDRSGSMSSMASDVIGGFNSFVADQRADGADAHMTLVQFDTQDAFEKVADAEPIASIAELTAATFSPRGGTPLLDATGQLIRHAETRASVIKQLKGTPENVLIVTFTDGEENQSSHFTRDQILKLVAEKEAIGWTFVFLGAGLDAYGESGGIGYAGGSTQAFAPDGQGTRVAFQSLSRATTSHRGKLRRGEQIDRSDFFEGDKAAEQDKAHRGN